MHFLIMCENLRIYKCTNWAMERTKILRDLWMSRWQGSDIISHWWPHAAYWPLTCRPGSSAVNLWPIVNRLQQLRTLQNAECQDADVRCPAYRVTRGSCVWSEVWGHSTVQRLCIVIQIQTHDTIAITIHPWHVTRPRTPALTPGGSNLQF